MPRLAANLTMMFTEVPFLDRFEAAADNGFKAVEFLFPYEHRPEEIAERIRRLGLEVALFNMPPGDWAAGERGMAAIPGREAEFARNAGIALAYARALGVRRVHAMSGITRGLDSDECRNTFIANMRTACDMFAPYGITILVEALNTRDVPGYFVAHQQEAADLCAAVERPNIAVQFDLYHAQIMDGDLTRLAERLNGRFAHVQIASVPERHEPDTGEVDYGHMLGVLDRLGYKGFVGCEYNPRNGTVAGLGWTRPWLGVEMALIPAERQSRIVDLVSQRPAVGIAELTRLLKVSHMTVRRDIRSLEEAGRVIAIAGGVRLADPTVSREAPHAAKAALSRVAKAAIGAAAARLVPEGAAIYLDAGTTILALAARLARRDDLTIVTNDFAVMELLSSQGGSVLHHTGGLVDRENRSAIGDNAARAIRAFQFDMAFISTSSFSKAGLSVTDPGKGVVKEAAVASAASSILLADSSKFGRRAPYASLPMQAFDMLVTDADLAPEWIEAIEDLGLSVIRGGGDTA